MHADIHNVCLCHFSNFFYLTLKYIGISNFYNESCFLEFPIFESSYCEEYIWSSQKRLLLFCCVLWKSNVAASLDHILFIEFVF